MPTVKIAANPRNSLLQISNFEKYQLKESELDLLSVNDMKYIFNKVKVALSNLKQEKTEFLANTNVRLGSCAFTHEMSLYTLRRQKIMKNYSMLENRISEYTREEKERLRTESRELFFYYRRFWENAKKINEEYFNAVTEETIKTEPMPEALKGGN